MPDWFPALVNAGRAFVTIGAVALFWIVSAWPSGALAITFAAVGVILFAPMADQAHAAVSFAAGCVLAAVSAAIVAFAMLPGLETFAAFCAAIGLCLVPAGALMSQPWQRVIFAVAAATFVPILGPANAMSYDVARFYNTALAIVARFYNTALAIVAGTAAAALAFRLLPPPSPAFRTRRLLALTLRDLRRLAKGHTPRDFQGRIKARLLAMPEQATPLQRAQLLAALSVGTEIVRLRPMVRRLGLGADLELAFAALARGESVTAAARLLRLDEALAGRAGPGREALRVRAGILAASEELAEHAAYFDAEAPA